MYNTYIIHIFLDCSPKMVVYLIEFRVWGKSNFEFNFSGKGLPNKVENQKFFDKNYIQKGLFKDILNSTKLNYEWSNIKVRPQKRFCGVICVGMKSLNLSNEDAKNRPVWRRAAMPRKMIQHAGILPTHVDSGN